jgi:hypothetical protein
LPFGLYIASKYKVKTRKNTFMASKKTWAEKLNEKKESVVKRIDFGFADLPAGCVMLISTPAIIESYIRKIPKGKKVTLQTMRKDLAEEAGAEYTCPLTTGIFLRIVAEANYEKYAKTKSLRGVAPFWRVVQPGSPLAKKLSFGEAFIKKQRKAENIID